MAQRRNSAIFAIFLHSKHQKLYQGTQGTQELPPTGSMALHDPSLGLTGSFKGPCDSRDSARLCLPFLKRYIL